MASIRDRIDRLAGAFPSGPDDKGLCLACRGPGSYRRWWDAVRRGKDPDSGDHCSQCGNLTYSGAIAAQRRALEAW